MAVHVANDGQGYSQCCCKHAMHADGALYTVPPRTALSLLALHSGGPNAQQYTSSHTASCIVAMLQLLQTRAQEEMSGGQRYPNVVRRAGDSASRRNARRRSELWFTLAPDPMGGRLGGGESRVAGSCSPILVP